MKKARIAVILLIGIAMVSGLACGGAEEPESLPTTTPKPSTVIEPTVGNIPQGWALSFEAPYGTYNESDGTKWGLIEYSDADDVNIVAIYYGDVPSNLEGRETDSDALISKAVEWSIFEPDETGTMVVAGQMAGYAKMYDSDLDWYDIDIVFIEGSTCVDIWASYEAITGVEVQVMSIVNGISFKPTDTTS